MDGCFSCEGMVPLELSAFSKSKFSAADQITEAWAGIRVIIASSTYPIELHINALALDIIPVIDAS